jgi:hypothetical protein
MFDFVSTYEIRLLSKLQLADYKHCLSSDQRLRFELLGLIKDGPDGVQLTSKGARVAQANCASDGRSEYLLGADSANMRVCLSELLS